MRKLITILSSMALLLSLTSSALAAPVPGERGASDAHKRSEATISPAP